MKTELELTASARRQYRQLFTQMATDNLHYHLFLDTTTGDVVLAPAGTYNLPLVKNVQARTIDNVINALHHALHMITGNIVILLASRPDLKPSEVLIPENCALVADAQGVMWHATVDNNGQLNLELHTS